MAESPKGKLASRYLLGLVSRDDLLDNIRTSKQRCEHAGESIPKAKLSG